MNVVAVVIATNTPNLLTLAKATEPILSYPVTKVLNGNKKVLPSEELDICIRELAGHSHTNCHGTVTVLLACGCDEMLFDYLHGARVSTRYVDPVMVYVITAFRDQWVSILNNGKQGDSFEVFEAIESVLRCS
jgi:hypothetical protein